MKSPGRMRWVVAALLGGGIAVAVTLLVAGNRTPSETSERAPVDGPGVPTADAPAPASNPFEQAGDWLMALQDVDRPSDDHQVVARMRAALRGQDVVAAQAALIALENKIDVSALDRTAWRTILEPYERHPDFEVRCGAGALLHRIDPRPDDVERAIAAVRSAGRSEAARAVATLVLMADGVVEGPVADAFLHVLRDGTEVAPSSVMEGLAFPPHGKFRRLDPRVVDRMIDIAGGLPPSAPDCASFLEYVAPHLEPRPEGVIDLALRVLETPGAQQDFKVVRGLSSGLEGPARTRTVARLLSLAASSPDTFVARRAIEVLKGLGSRPERAALARIADDEKRPPEVREAAQRAADVLALR